MGANLHNNNNDDIITDINITPFVDVVLVLLIIFMVTAPMIYLSSIKVNLPKGASQGERLKKTYGLVLYKDGTIELNGERVDEDKLRMILLNDIKNNPQLTVLIRADKDLRYGFVVHFIDLIKQCGVTRFAINIERESP